MKTPFTPGLATPNRRRFLKITGSLAGLGLLSQFDTLAQAAADDDYRALVCIFMYGGNDSSNLLLPYESSEYNRYAAARSNLALPRDGLLPISPAIRKASAMHCIPPWGASSNSSTRARRPSLPMSAR